jgi:GWxTD domain-containing protein
MFRLLFLLLLSSPLVLVAQLARPLSEKPLSPYPEQPWCRYRLKHQGEQTILWLESFSAAAYTLVYKTYADEQGRRLSHSELLNIPLQNPNARYACPIKVPADLFWLEIELRNTTNGQVLRDVIWVNRKQENEQGLRIFNADSVLLLRHYLYKGEAFQLQNREGKPGSFFVRYFRPSAAAALPPYADEEQGFDPITQPADSRLRVTANTWVHFEEEGTYFVQLDSLSNKGVFLHCVSADYPRLTEAKTLVWSLRYLTKQEEYQNLLSATDLKAALDAFWLNLAANNPERARVLIKDYYHRVQDANAFFTTDKLGWQTDRGMVFVVMGRPDRVYKYANKEYWWYGPSRARNQAIEFVFVRRGERYQLQRTEHYRPVWTKALRRWRKG